MANSLFFGPSKSVSLIDYWLYLKINPNSNPMKSKLFYLIAIVLISACSSPKYTYNFDYYNYNSGKKASQPEVAQSEAPATHPELLVASKENTMIADAEVVASEEAKAAIEAVKKTYLQMSKVERKEFRKDVKELIKEKKESIKAVKKTNAMDNDLKLAAIFGAVGIVALIISGDVFYIIGGIALIIGVVFFVKWLVRQ